MIRHLAVVLVVVGATTITGCGTDDVAARCGPAVVEQSDSNLGHLLPNATPPTYLTDPPTSGPHTPGAEVHGLVDSPLSDIVQVTTLETGAVIVQYRDPRDLPTLRSLAGPAVVVAPAPKLPARIIATAWLRKLTCRGVDRGAIERFIGDVQSRATSTPTHPAGHGS